MTPTETTTPLRSRPMRRRRVLQAATGLGFAALGVFPAARRAYAEGYDIWTGACPSYASDHDCSPGCGPSPIFGAACETSGSFLGFHKDDGVQWMLRPNQCLSGGYDGWLWRYNGSCGICACHVERRCHDGYRNTSSGWVRSICRWNTDCGCPGSVTWTVTRQGHSGHRVEAVQYLLSHRGYQIAVTGSFNWQTRQRVQAFQTDELITADGVVGAQTWSLLVVTVRNGNTSDAVRAAQAVLVGHGYSLAIDGVFGPLTQGAAADFQRQHDLVADGIVGQNTWRTLIGAAT